MDIELHKIKIGDITKNYVDNNEDGVIGYDGRLNIRPKYQREFIYKGEKRDAVIRTILNKFPLNVMYWVQISGDSFDSPDAEFEILDGQQRTVSFCQYVNGDYSIDSKYFHSLTTVERNIILNYECMIYVCKGTDLEKLEWFKTINIASEKLTDQELRNAVYAGPWLTDAKLKFSKSNSAGALLSGKYVNGAADRQEILETAISWISDGNIEEYMSRHQFDANANELWVYFKNVIDWVELTFIKYRKEMKGIDWNTLYKNYHDRVIDTHALEEEISKLYMDDDVDSRKGIYFYIFDKEEKHLNLRAFTPAQKERAYNRQRGLCPRCAALNKPTKDKVWDISEMEADHITPWHLGGRTIDENCQMLCKTCNREKGGH